MSMASPARPLVSMLRTLDLEARYSVPRRMDEGYGLSRDAMTASLVAKSLNFLCT